MKLALKYDFLKPELCDYIIQRFGNSLQKTVTVGEEIEGYRIAQGEWIYEEDDIIEEIKFELSKITNLPIRNQEKPHIVRYDIGGRYKPHHDYFFENVEDFDNQCTNRGGQRVFTAIIYLNDDFKGGETRFTEHDIDIKPKKGLLSIWRNLNDQSKPDWNTQHESIPVEEGTKWVLIFWIRENKFV